MGVIIFLLLIIIALMSGVDPDLMLQAFGAIVFGTTKYFGMVFCAVVGLIFLFYILVGVWLSGVWCWHWYWDRRRKGG